MTRTSEAADVAAQVDALVDNLEKRVWADVKPVRDARQKVQAALAAGPALHRLVGGLPRIEGVMAAAYDRLARGESVDPDRFAAAVAAAGSTADAARAAAILAAGGTDGARAELVAAEHAHQGAALAVLDHTVKALVAIARPLLEVAAEVEGTRQYAKIGETAVALERAAVAHRRIREVQFSVTFDPMDGDVTRVLRTFGIVRDVSSCLPRVISMGARVTAGYEPEVPELEDGEAILRFVCRDDLEVWVPSYPQARKARAAFNDHIADLRDEAENPVRAARDDSGDPRVSIRDGITTAPTLHIRF